jgi:uncharacterized membrane protein
MSASKLHNSEVSYWKRAHHDWRFWIGLSLMLLAMATYIMIDNLSLVLR